MAYTSMWSWRFLPTPWKVVHHVDSDRAELVRRPDSGEQEQPRGADGTGRDDHLLRRARDR